MIWRHNEFVVFFFIILLLLTNAPSTLSRGVSQSLWGGDRSVGGRERRETRNIDGEKADSKQTRRERVVVWGKEVSEERRGKMVVAFLLLELVKSFFYFCKANPETQKDHHMAYLRVHSRASSLYRSLSVLYILAISGTSGSSGLGSHKSEQIDSRTGKFVQNK